MIVMMLVVLVRERRRRRRRRRRLCQGLSRDDPWTERCCCRTESGDRRERWESRDGWVKWESWVGWDSRKSNRTNVDAACAVVATYVYVSCRDHGGGALSSR
jgi:hypothetical protein